MDAVLRDSRYMQAISTRIKAPMSQPIGRESGQLAPKRSSQVPFLVVATLSVGFLLRALWIATADFPEESAAKPYPQREHNIAATHSTTERSTLSASEYAMLMSVCPTGAVDLPAELKPVDSAIASTNEQLRLANRPGSWPNSGRIQVANKPATNNPRPDLGAWLVPPEEWYGPAGVPQPDSAEPTLTDPVEQVGEESLGKNLEGDSAEEEPDPQQVVTAKPEIHAPVVPDKSVTNQPTLLRAATDPYDQSSPTGNRQIEDRESNGSEPNMIESNETGSSKIDSRDDEVPAQKPETIESVPLGPTVLPLVEMPVDELPLAKPLQAQPSLKQPSPTQPQNGFFPAPDKTVAEEPNSQSLSELELFSPPHTIQSPLPPQVVTPPVGRVPAPVQLPVQSPNLNPHGNHAALAAEARKAADGKTAYEAHRDLYLKNCYPSARDCAECHKQIYEEWSTSSHAYAYISPMFHKFEQTISTLSQGTVGHFCTRCHSPVAASMGLPRSTPVGKMSGAQVEGVTCIVCHRVNERYGKTNGERRVIPGSLEDPIYGGIGGEGVRQAIANRDKYKVKTSAADKKPGQLIHNEGRFFDQLTHAEACTSCHQVAVHPGIKLEVVWEQYRNSPACKKGVSCQDCHMGRIPGVPSGYNYGPIAEVGGKTVNNHRKQANHSFFGPGYSIAHPGVFPQHKDADKWSLDEWLTFDWRAGWGTDDFEDQVEEAEDQGIDTSRWFPVVWADVDDRCDARDIISDNQKKLKRKSHLRELVMENGSKVDGPFFRTTPRKGQDLEFDYIVANLNEGHNLPTASLGAQPQLWANVVLIGPRGQRLWETGYLDTKGDLCDIHSEDVRRGRARFDSQLFNLQTMFLYTGAVGTDREWTLPVNISLDQVPHLRPGAVPVSVLNHPPFIRMESRSIAPLGKKRVKYKVPADLMCEPGRYRLSFRLRSRLEPMYFMRFCDATNEMMRSMTEQTLDIHPYSVEFEVR